MKFIDLHCDTISVLLSQEQQELYSNSLSVDIEKLIKGEAMAKFFALFFPLKEVLSAHETTV